MVADGIKGILIYLLVYTFMNLGAFGVITSLRHKNVIGDELDDLNGLYSRAPVEAVLMLIFMLSLAGIPPLAGFWGGCNPGSCRNLDRHRRCTFDWAAEDRPAHGRHGHRRWSGGRNISGLVVLTRSCQNRTNVDVVAKTKRPKTVQ